MARVTFYLAGRNQLSFCVGQYIADFSKYCGNGENWYHMLHSIL